MSAVAVPLPARSPWRHPLLALGVLLVLIGLLYRDTALAMISIWARSDTFAHAFLVVPIALWLIWRRRAEIAPRLPQTARWPLLPIGAAAALWLAGELVSVNAATQFALVALMALAVPLMLGREATRPMLFPLGFLFFAVPFGEFMMPQLMLWTADFLALALRLTGVPVYREGLQLLIPTGTWSVIEACSGVRYLIASLVVGTLFAYLHYRSLRRRLVFVAISIAVPIVANWLRAYGIVIVGHYSGNKLAVGVDHLIYGWLFFGVVMAVLFAIGLRWSEADQPAAAAPAAPSAPAAPAHAPATGAAGRAAHLPLAAAAAALVALPHAVLWSLDEAGATGKPRLALPAALADGWARADQPLSDWRPAFQNPPAEAHVRYERGADSVGVYVAYYRGQQTDSKLITSTNALVTTRDAKWVQVARGMRTLDAGGSAVTLRTAELRGSVYPTDLAAERLVVRQLYWVGGRLTSSDSTAKLFAALHRLLGRGDDGAVLMLYARQRPEGAADALLDRFVGRQLQEITKSLDRTREAAGSGEFNAVMSATQEVNR